MSYDHETFIGFGPDCGFCDDTGVWVLLREHRRLTLPTGVTIDEYVPLEWRTCTCRKGLQLEAAKQWPAPNREAAKHCDLVADHYTQMAAQAADEEAARIDCGGGF